MEFVYSQTSNVSVGCLWEKLCCLWSFNDKSFKTFHSCYFSMLSLNSVVYHFQYCADTNLKIWKSAVTMTVVRTRQVCNLTNRVPLTHPLFIILRKIFLYTYSNCTVHFSINTHQRWCQSSQLITTCPQNYQNSSIREKCVSGPQALVRVRGGYQIYKNIFCVVCHNDVLPDIECGENSGELIICMGRQAPFIQWITSLVIFDLSWAVLCLGRSILFSYHSFLFASNSSSYFWSQTSM